MEDSRISEANVDPALPTQSITDIIRDVTVFKDTLSAQVFASPKLLHQDPSLNFLTPQDPALMSMLSKSTDNASASLVTT